MIWHSSYKSTTYDTAWSTWYDILCTSLTHMIRPDQTWYGILRISLPPMIQPDQYDMIFFVPDYHLRYSLINIIWHYLYKSITYDTAWSIWYDILRTSLPPTILPDQYDLTFFVQVYQLRYSLINMTFLVQVYYLRYSLISMMWHPSYRSTIYDTAWSVWYDILRTSLSHTTQPD